MFRSFFLETFAQMRRRLNTDNFHVKNIEFMTPIVKHKTFNSWNQIFRTDLQTKYFIEVASHLKISSGTKVMQ